MDNGSATYIQFLLRVKVPNLDNSCTGSTLISATNSDN